MIVDCLKLHLIDVLIDCIIEYLDDKTMFFIRARKMQMIEDRRRNKNAMFLMESLEMLSNTELDVQVSKIMYDDSLDGYLERLKTKTLNIKKTKKAMFTRQKKISPYDSNGANNLSVKTSSLLELLWFLTATQSFELGRQWQHALDSDCKHISNNELMADNIETIRLKIKRVEDRIKRHTTEDDDEEEEEYEEPRCRKCDRTRYDCDNFYAP